MIWFLIFAVVVVVLGLFALVSLRVVPPPHATTIIRLSPDRLQITRGALPGPMKQDVAEVLRDAGVTRGFIAITRDKRVIFSRGIPVTIHQRLRNVLLNRWR